MKSIFSLFVVAALAGGALRAQATTYTLGTTNLALGPAAGTNSVLLTVTPNTGTWTASTNALWLHLSPGSQSGTGSTNVIFSCDANSSLTRTGTLAIAGLNFTVIQAGSTYVAAGVVTNLVPGLAYPDLPYGVAVDGAGNVFFSDFNEEKIEKWSATSNTVTTLATYASGVGEPRGVAVDSADNVYVADSYNAAIDKWTATNNSYAPLISSGLAGPVGVAVDATGNVYIADATAFAIKKWTATNHIVTTLPIDAYLYYPYGVALDPAGNVFVADSGVGTILKWTVANTNVTTLASLGSSEPICLALDGADNVYTTFGTGNIIELPVVSTNVTSLASAQAEDGMAVDGAGNIYFSDGTQSAIDELPHAFVDPTPKAEGLAGGNDALPAVVPATASLRGALAPASDSPWLTITSTNGGVVSYSFTANTGPARTANISLLGQTIPVTQGGSTYTLSTSNLLEGPAAGSYGIVLTVNPNSGTWTATTNAPWLHLSPANQGGTGGATVTFSYDANPSATRTGAIIIEGITVTITQAGSTYVAAGQENTFVDPTPRTESAAAGSDALPVVLPSTVNLTGPYMPTSDQSWLTITGTNNGVVTFAFPANLGPARTAHITLLGHSIAVTQEAPSFNLGATARLEGPGAGRDSVVLAVVPNSAPWMASTNVPWLHLSPANQSGTGSTNLVFAYDANPGATRTGTLTIGGQILAVTQAGSTYVAAAASGFTNLFDTDQPLAVAVNGAGNVYFAEYNEMEALAGNNDEVLFLLSAGNDPNGIAVDGASNVYFANSSYNEIEVWLAASNTVTNLVSGLNNPTGVALDSAGNLYFCDTGNLAIKKWTSASGVVTTLVNTGLISPSGVAVDAAGNVYIADLGTNVVYRWNPASNTLTSLVSGLAYPAGVAVDGAGNVYIADSGHNAIAEWVAASGLVTNLLSGLGGPKGVAVDATGNVYVANTGDNEINELPYAFVDTAPKTVSEAAGSDSLPAVLPATENLGGPFTPACDQSWLTITGTNNGVVSFTFTSNAAGTNLPAHISVLGQVITVTQNGPFALSTSTRVEGSTAGADSVILTASPALPNWTNTANDFWLHLAPAFQTGAGSTNIVFTFDGNSGLTRTGSVTIARMTLTVIQAGSTYVAANPWTPLVTSGLSNPEGVAVDPAGNVYIADTYNNAVEEWSVAGNTVTTLVASDLSNPEGVAVDTAGNVYIADTDNDAIEKWSPTNNNLTTLVDSGNWDLSQPQGVAVDGSGNVYIANTYEDEIDEWSAASSNVTALVSSGLNEPAGVAVDFAGNIYIGDTYDYALKEWNAAGGNLTTLTSSGLSLPQGVAVDVAGNVYVADTYGYAIRKWTAAYYSLNSLVSAGLNQPSGVAVDGSGNLYIADTDNNAIEEVPYAFVDPSPRYENPAAGSDALPTVLPAAANLTGPFLPVSDSAWLTLNTPANGVVSFSFTTNNGPSRTANITLLGQTISVTQYSPNYYAIGTYQRFEGSGAGSDSIALGVFPNTGDWTASIQYADWLHLSLANQSGTGGTNLVFTYDANPGPTRSTYVVIAGNWAYITQAGSTYVAADPITPLIASGLATPAGVAVDGAGNVYIADKFNNAIKEWVVASNTVIALVSTGLNHPTGVAVDGSGNVFIADTGNNAIEEWLVNTATVTNLVSGLNHPAGVAVDAYDNVYIADSDNNAVEEWPPDGPLNTLVSSGLNHPAGVAVDVAGNVYIADTTNNAVKEWMAASGNVKVLAPGLNNPAGVAVDGAGNVYIANSGNNAMVEWLAASNSVTPLAFPGLNHPIGVAVDGTGNLYVGDSGNNALKELPSAFVDPTPRLETGAAGSDALPAVLPATENLGGPFAPASDESWLTITGTNNDVVGFDFPANIGASRTGHISLLGQSVAVTQSAPSYTLGAANRLEGSGAGSDSVVLAVVPNIASWTASTNTTWLHLSPANRNGTGSTNVIFSYDANPGATRLGTLTIGGQPLAVTQAGSTYVAANWLTNLVSAGLSDPTGIAVDGAGDVYFANTGGYGLYEWTPTNDTAIDLYGLYALNGVAVDGPGNIVFADSYYGGIFSLSNNAASYLLYDGDQLNGVAVDPEGDVYFANINNAAIQELTAASGVAINLVTTGLTSPSAVAVDAAGNLYITDTATNVLYEWNVANGVLTTLATGLTNAAGVAVDGGGNVYIADTGHNAIKEWVAASRTVKTLVSSGLNNPSGVAVDSTGNVYFADSGNNAIKELTYAFEDPTSKSENGNAGSDFLSVLLPTTENLEVPFAPASDQSWLTITGATNGVVYFAFQANTGSIRTAHVSVLGQNITVTQAVASTSPILTGGQFLGNGAFVLSFTSPPGGSFTVLTSTNLLLPLTNWPVAGTASYVGSDLYQFTNPPAPINAQRFFRVRAE